jgi:hypothetical protein
MVESKIILQFPKEAAKEKQEHLLGVPWKLIWKSHLWFL